MIHRTKFAAESTIDLILILKYVVSIFDVLFMCSNYGFLFSTDFLHSVVFISVVCIFNKLQHSRKRVIYWVTPVLFLAH